MKRKNLFWAFVVLSVVASVASAAIETVELRVEGMT